MTSDQPTDPPAATGPRRWSELAVVLVMSLTAVLTAWTGYQATKWSGAYSDATSQASADRIEATRLSNTSDHQRAIDVSLFVAWIEAIADDDRERIDFIRDRFPARMEPAVTAWLAHDPRNNDQAPATPFELDQYVIPAEAEAAQLLDAAQAHVEEAAHATERVELYVLMTVLFSVVLLFAGMSSKLGTDRARQVILDVAVGGLGVGIAMLVVLYVRG